MDVKSFLGLLLTITSSMDISSACSVVPLLSNRIKEDIPIGTAIARVTNFIATTFTFQKGNFKQLTLVPDGCCAAYINISEHIRNYHVELWFSILCKTENEELESSTLTIQVEDVNDPPIFDELYNTFNVSENWPVGIPFHDNISSSDPDSNIHNFNRATYDLIQSDDYFSIQPNCPCINNVEVICRQTKLSLNQPLNYLEQQKHTFSIVVRDGGNLNDTIIATLNVIDEDNLSPIFEYSNYSATINDNSILVPLIIPTVPATIFAYDQDKGINEKIHYTITQDITNFTDHFEINKETGILSLSKPIYYNETKCEVILVIQAVQANDKNKFANALVTIKINPPTDYEPQFLKSYYYQEIYEHLPQHTPILQVSAQDPYMRDFVGFTFEIDPGATNALEVFEINEDTGWISVKDSKLLDYDVPPQSYPFMVYTVLTSSHEKKFNTSVNITLLDINDNSPIFTSSNEFVFSLENPVDMLVSATDKDSGGNGKVSFEILEQVPFSVDKETGQLTKNAEVIDVCTHPKVSFSIIAHDNPDVVAEKRSTVSTVNIVIDKTCEKPIKPKFSQYNYTFSIKEEEKDAFIGQVSVSNVAVNSLTFEIIPPNDYFFITSDGTILTTSKPIYRFDGAEGLLYVKAVTNKVNEGIFIGTEFETSVAVTVRINDTNNHAPEFLETTYSTKIPENSFNEFKVIQVTAVDKDEEMEYREFTYHIKTQTVDAFKIDANTGWITVNNHALLDYETIQTISLKITTVEREKNNKNIPPGETDITIELEDVNDNNPIFKTGSLFYQFEVDTDSTQIGKVEADDNDGTQANSNVTFKMLETSISFPFRILPDGSIIKNDILKPCQYHQYQLPIVASDNPTDGTPSRSTVTIATVKVKEVCITPEKSKFTQVIYTSAINENAASGVVQKLEITPPVSDVKFTFINGNGDLFGINNDEIIIKSAIPDHKIAEQYTLVVQAEYKVTVGNVIVIQEDVATVIVGISDINNHQPIFEKSEYKANIVENPANGSLVTVVLAVDDDKDLNANFTYELIGDDSKAFQIDSSGWITIRNNLHLDRERQPTFQFEVIAKETVPSGFDAKNAVIIVTLEDVNDNNPQFNSNNYEISLDLDTIAVGAILQNVNASDLDEGANGEIIYEILHPSTPVPFKIEQNGNLIITDSLDPCLYPTKLLSFTIAATDLSNQIEQNRSSVAIIEIKLNNYCNLKPKPIFGSAIYHVNVDEKQEARIVTTMKATIENNYEIKYNIEEGNNASYFKIDENSGEVSTTKQLGIDEMETYVLLIKASTLHTLPGSAEPLQLDAFANLIVTVNDINDHRPEFTEIQISVSINENSAIDTVVTIVSAVDKDKGKNSAFIYKIEEIQDTFSLDENTGIIKVSKAENLDRENHPGPFTLTIITQENELPASNSPVNGNKATVKVQLLDMNDNNPRFEPSSLYKFTLDETNKSFNIIASDDDLDKNSEIYYHIVDPLSVVPFEISNNGLLTMTKGLDPCLHPTGVYYFSLVATDISNIMEQNRSSVATIEITLSDSCSFGPTPKFDSAWYDVSVNEKEPPKIIFTMVVSEAGSSTIIYSIAAGNSSNYFSINSATGQVSTTRPLDIEEAETHILLIKASTTQQLPGSSTPLMIDTFSNLVVTVIDINDHRPEFNQTIISVFINENSAADTVVTIVSAVDKDKGKNSAFIYKIEEIQDTFSLDENTGIIKVSKAENLDRENHPGPFTLTIITQENEPPANNSPVNGNKATVIVQLLDMNDNNPRFEPSSLYKFTVDETNKSFNITASDDDLDKNSEIHYHIVDPLSVVPFEISNNGLLTMTKGLDPCLHPTGVYYFSLVATDISNIMEQNRSSVATIEIILSDTCSFGPTPKFDSAWYDVSINEKEPPGLIFTMVVSEAGNSTIIYSIAAGNSSNDFSINSASGQVSTTRPLDIEEAETHILLIKASTTQQLPGSSTPLTIDTFSNLVVTVVDINDHRPEFNQTIIHVFINENSAADTVVTIVSAVDKDKGKNSAFIYKFEEIQDTFSLDENTGIIKVSKAENLDRENHPGPFTLTIITQENELPASNSPVNGNKATVRVQLLDMNDNNPRFEPSSLYKFTVDGTNKSFNITASDDDLEKNSEIYYHIVDPLSVVPFEISNNGLLTMTKGLDPCLHPTGHYYFSLVATDISNVMEQNRSSVATIEIILSNTCSFGPTPKFDSAWYDVSINEKEPPGLIFTMIVSEAGNSTIIYSIAAGNSSNYFSINSATGQVSTTRPLDIEEAETHILLIKASTTQQLPGSSTPLMIDTFSNLVVTVIDINDHRPQFNQTIIHVFINENSAADTVVTIVSAVDKDKGKNSAFIYKFEEIQDTFSLDENIGIIKVSKAENLDRENHPGPFTLTIITQEIELPASNSPVNGNKATVRVQLLDMNDNNPKFEPSSLYKFTFSETIKSFNITASDDDLDKNSEIYYHIVDPLSVVPFEISNNGLLTMTKGLDPCLHPTGVYYFSLVATDISNVMEQNRSSVATVEITLSDSCSLGSTSKFQSAWYDVSINEKEPPGLIFTMIVSDPGNSTVFYSIAAGNSSNDFTINLVTGQVSTTRPLDIEEAETHILLIKASTTQQLPGSSTPLTIDTFSNLIVTVVDINDHRPEFNPKQISVSINENSATDTLVTIVSAVDKDKGLNAVFTYQIVGNENIFKLNSNTGEITVNEAKALDRETHPQPFILTIIADEAVPIVVNSPEEIDNVTVTIYLIDMNDNNPMFGQIAEFHLNKSSSFIGTVSATDDDIGENGDITYSILEKASSVPFRVNPSGDLFSTAIIDPCDYTTGVYTFSLLATDHSNDMEQNRSTVVPINIFLDEECPLPQKPHFLKSFYNISFPEKLTGVIFKEQATGEELSYSLEGGNDGNYFVINSTSGAVSVIQELNINEKEIHVLVIKAASNYKFPGNKDQLTLEDFTTLYLNVEDVNDNYPIFNNLSYNVSINENSAVGSLVTIVSAIDADRGINSEFHYELNGLDSTFFEINSGFGWITVKDSKMLDREVKEIFEFQVKAIEKEVSSASSEPSITTVFVILLDVNDNNPIFRMSTYSASLNSDISIGSIIPGIVITATDEDLQDNGRVSYELFKTNPYVPFDLLGNGSIIVTSNLSACHPNNYLSILAQDNPLDQSQRRTSVTLVTINIQGSCSIRQNCSKPIHPQFNDVFYNCSFTEGPPSVTETCCFQVDLGSGSNPKLDIFGNDHVNRFILDGNCLRAKENLDREEITAYFFFLRLQTTFKMDEFSEDLTLQNISTIQIKVLDVNDNIPEFTQDKYNVIIQEHAVSGSLVAILEAIDKDEGDNAAFNYTLKNDLEVFQINPMSGWISVKNSSKLDREKSPKFILEVEAIETKSDVHNEFNSVNITVTLSDINDNNPEFSNKGYNFTINEKFDSSNIGMTFAIDEDIEDYGKIKYNIHSCAGENIPFAVNDTGHLNIIDKNSINSCQRPVINFAVIAADQPKEPEHPRSSIVDVRIDITAENPCPSGIPKFEKSEYKIFIKENIVIGSHVHQIQVTDTNLPVEYSLLSLNGLNHFIISNMKIGTIVTGAEIDRESQEEYFLLLTAKYKEDEAFTAITIIIEDENDEKPTFEKTCYTRMLITNFTSFIPSLIVKAIDNDKPGTDNSHVNYKILESEDDAHTMFVIDSETGEININNGTNVNTILNQHLNKKNLTLKIKAQDKGVPVQESNIIPVYMLLQDFPKQEISPTEASLSWANALLKDAPWLIAVIAAIIALLLLITIIFIVLWKKQKKRFHFLASQNPVASEFDDNASDRPLVNSNKEAAIKSNENVDSGGQYDQLVNMVTTFSDTPTPEERNHTLNKSNMFEDIKTDQRNSEVLETPKSEDTLEVDYTLIPVSTNYAVAANTSAPKTTENPDTIEIIDEVNNENLYSTVKELDRFDFSNANDNSDFAKSTKPEALLLPGQVDESSTSVESPKHVYETLNKPPLDLNKSPENDSKPNDSKLSNRGYQPLQHRQIIPELSIPPVLPPKLYDQLNPILPPRNEMSSPPLNTIASQPEDDDDDDDFDERM